MNEKNYELLALSSQYVTIRPTTGVIASMGDAHARPPGPTRRTLAAQQERRPMRPAVTALLAAATVGAASAALALPPQYTIVDIGLARTGDSASQGFRVSTNGIATGRSLGTGTVAYTWTLGGGIVALPNLASPSRTFGVGNGVNSSGIVVGTGATTAFGSSPLPVIWQGGVASQLPLPAGQTLGRANDVNDSLVAVGSINSGSLERGSLYAGGTGTVITQTTSIGCYLVTGFSLNNSGRVVGFGADPSNAARNVGYVLDLGSGQAYEVGTLPGRNGAIAFDVSEAGAVVGASMQNQGSSVPFIWTSGGGTVEIPLPVGTSQGSARGVNSAGWAVGTASSATSIPFLYDGASTYRLMDLLPNPDGWDLIGGTSNSAFGISENGIIVGTALHNGQTHAYAMIPIPAPGAVGVLALAGALAARRRR
jgi:hypothetical protein